MVRLAQIWKFTVWVAEGQIVAVTRRLLGSHDQGSLGDEVGREGEQGKFHNLEYN